MNGTTYNQLMMFHTIAQEGSITAAARKLEIAPPSVSQALKMLEEQLGLPLFTRTTRRIELTEAGQRLYDRTLTTMSDLNLAVESVSDLSRVPSGKVRITVPRFVYQSLLKPIYIEFCQRYPDIQLEISVSDKTVDIIREGFDMGIRFGDKVEEGMIARQLTHPVKEALFASPSYVAQFGLPNTPEDLKKHKLIQYRFISSNQIAPLKLNNKGEAITVDMPSALIVNDTDLMVDAAINGLGIGRIVTPIVQEGFRTGELVPVLEEYWQPYSGLYVYFHKNTQKAKRVRVLIDFLIEKTHH
ncbi:MULTISPECIES: LysR family transcriptional regulator [Vibrio]|jgi:DNA-binding transcriptional LysR family regulator|uniref:Bacterial regulatory helix-turn-helix, lysR family protein n=1 Tax=Vibrio harveyi TaxID=669 RepID=A0A3A1PTH0_VIBHA|nr:MULTISPECIES: LysR family transcriptional regulator [Vibrio]AIV07559.1 LysR family transcriptional regulator [Vibrio harveyi]AMG01309.1 LysR family transcriptional regulator [Vibrio harveyi]APP07255.1 LysR family transcriptional regulator [Vibrio harveyi]EKM18201.1 bacterial regulatory helix-turn-helix, lysR family protein [Vibrio harveyi]EKM28240.1 bacterial regulatory helix-turn-helix, lysR family protein [Vibrio harveyi]